MIVITSSLSIPISEIELTAIRSSGPGGQNVNKVSSAAHLRFNIFESSLPTVYKHRLLSLKDQRISKDGVIVIKAQSYRTWDKNRLDAIQRLQLLLQSVTRVRKVRKATKPTRSSQIKRLDGKAQQGRKKALRSKRIID